MRQDLTKCVRAGSYGVFGAVKGLQRLRGLVRRTAQLVDILRIGSKRMAKRIHENLRVAMKSQKGFHLSRYLRNKVANRTRFRLAEGNRSLKSREFNNKHYFDNKEVKPKEANTCKRVKLCFEEKKPYQPLTSHE